MNKITKVGLLSLIAIMQAVTLVGGFIAYQQMSETISGLERMYLELYEETHDLWVTFGLTINPFAPLIPLILLGLFLTLVLLVDQIRHKNA
jgi:H+/Cl- antiporter ClcA